MTPLISVITPCYNAAHTLLMALASLIAQTYDHWECVLVDDGSTDHPEEIVRQVHDPRIRYIRLDRNYGRGVARQRCHDEARGEFIAMLDADDWYYTTKLERQLAFFDEHPEIVVLSGGMMVLHENGEPFGYRCAQAIRSAPLSKLTDPSLAYPPAIMRRGLIKDFTFNPQFHRAQDIDFLQRVCLQYPFANLPELIYAYTEYQSYRWTNIPLAFTSRIKALRALAKRYPFQARKEIMIVRLKYTLYSALHLIGQERLLLNRRSQPATPAMLAQYHQEKEKVATVVRQITGKN